LADENGDSTCADTWFDWDDWCGSVFGSDEYNDCDLSNSIWWDFNASDE